MTIFHILKYTPIDITNSTDISKIPKKIILKWINQCYVCTRKSVLDIAPIDESGSITHALEIFDSYHFDKCITLEELELLLVNVRSEIQKITNKYDIANNTAMWTRYTEINNLLISMEYIFTEDGLCASLGAMIDTCIFSKMCKLENYDNIDQNELDQIQYDIFYKILIKELAEYK